MFPDNMIAKNLSIGSTKIVHVVTHGLAPYFQQVLTTEIQGCSEFVVCFDEALNEIIQRGQMDLVIRYWNENKHEISARYLTSTFLGHARADNLLEKFKEGLQCLSLRKLIQVSMDGPAVNYKFLDNLKVDLKHSDSDREL